MGAACAWQESFSPATCARLHTLPARLQTELPSDALFASSHLSCIVTCPSILFCPILSRPFLSPFLFLSLSFSHLDEYWKGALLLEHSAVCPADWVEEFSDNRSGGRGTLTWETWTALAPAARCWKWYKTLFAEMATLLRASFKAPEWDEYANWALSLCMRPKQAAEDCKADAALVTHLQETLSTVRHTHLLQLPLLIAHRRRRLSDNAQRKEVVPL